MWRIFIINKTLFTTKQVQIINKKYIIISMLDTKSKTFVVYVVIRKQEKIPVYFKRQALIKIQSGAHIGILLFDKASTKILAKYFN